MPFCKLKIICISDTNCGAKSWLVPQPAVFNIFIHYLLLSPLLINIPIALAFGNIIKKAKRNAFGLYYSYAFVYIAS